MFKCTGLGAAMALTLALAAQAQTPMQGAPPAGDPSASRARDDGSSIARLGMIVKDNDGDTVGRVVGEGRAANGEASVTVQVDGRPVTLAATMFAPDGAGRLVSSVTKEQIKSSLERSS